MDFVQNGSFYTFLLKNEAFSPKTNVIICDRSSLLFYHKNDFKQYHMCVIYESGVITEICEFIDTLEKHSCSYSLDESNNILKESIATLEKQYSDQLK